MRNREILRKRVLFILPIAIFSISMAGWGWCQNGGGPGASSDAAIAEELARPCQVDTQSYAFQRLRAAYEMLSEDMRRKIGPVEEVRVMDSIPRAGAYFPRYRLIAVNRAVLNDPLFPLEDIANTLNHETHHKMQHDRFTRLYGLTDAQFEQWFEGNRARAEYGAARAEERSGLPSLFENYYAVDANGRPVWLTTELRAEGRELLSLVSRKDVRGLQQIAENNQDPFIREQARNAIEYVNWMKANSGSGRLKMEIAREGLGFANFMVALVMSDIMEAAATGDPERIKQLFTEGFTDPDFYASFALFIGGARAGQAIWSRTLGPRMKPGLMNKVTSTTFVLGLGMLIPDIIYGKLKPEKYGPFDPAMFALSLGGFVGSITLTESVEVPLLRRILGKIPGLGRLFSRFRPKGFWGSWIGSAFNLAWILFQAHQIDKFMFGIIQRVMNWMDKGMYTDYVKDETDKLLEMVYSSKSPPADEMITQLLATSEAFNTYRNFLYLPIIQGISSEMEYGIVGKWLGRAQELDMEGNAMAMTGESIDPILMGYIIQEYGSFDNFLRGISEKDRSTLSEEEEKAMRKFEETRDRLFKKVYEEGRMEPYGYVVGNDGQRRPVYVQVPAGKPTFGNTLGKLSDNRLQLYDQQIQLYSLALSKILSGGWYKKASDEDAGTAVDALVLELDRLVLLKAMDEAMYLSITQSEPPNRGILDELDRVTSGTE